MERDNPGPVQVQFMRKFGDIKIVKIVRECVRFLMFSWLYSATVSYFIFWYGLQRILVLFTLRVLCFFHDSKCIHSSAAFAPILMLLSAHWLRCWSLVVILTSHNFSKFSYLKTCVLCKFCFCHEIAQMFKHVYFRELLTDRRAVMWITMLCYFNMLYLRVQMLTLL